jgi:hypothetical protein
MMENMKKLFIGMAFTMMVSTAFAQKPAEATAKKEGWDFDAGADVRLRYEFKDNWMRKSAITIDPTYEDYSRTRTRVWGKATYDEDLGAYLRLGNEFRDYRNALDNDKNEFPDELFIDNLYFDFKNLGDRTDLRIGRQDIKEGAGRLINDGTPGDGSRSMYFNAILAKVRMLEKSDVDLMATWNPYRDDATVGNPHDIYDLSKIRGGNPYSKMDEKGLMAYSHYNEIKNFPMEFYWIWKEETRFYDSKGVRYPSRDFHTLGMRLMPKFNDNLSGEVETAVQGGEVDGKSGMQSRDIFAYMGYAGLTYSEKDVVLKPKLTGALLYLSGDKDSYYKTTDGSTDNGWNPVFNRTPWFGEMASGMYDQARWSNLIYPHLETAIEPHEKHTVRLQAGPMFAAEKDNGATDSYRGLFTQLRYEFPLLSKMFGKRGDLTGAVLGEAITYGDYYTHETAPGNEDVGYFLRFELTAKF